MQPTGPGATLYLALFGITLGFVSTFWAFSYVRHVVTAEFRLLSSVPNRRSCTGTRFPHGCVACARCAMSCICCASQHGVS